MNILIKTDLRQRTKNPLTWFIIFILCLMSMLNIIEMQKLRLNRPFQGHDIYSYGSSHHYDWSMSLDDRKKKLYPKAEFSLDLYTNIPKQIAKANEENNVKEVIRLMTFYHLLWAKTGYVTNDPIMNTVFYNKIINIWNEVSEGISYEKVDYYPYLPAFDTEKYALLTAQYYYQLYKNDFEPIYYDDINNITYLYNYFFSIVPKFIVIISIIFIYNTINKEKNRGSLKLVFTQSVSRWEYYISKWISGLIYIIFILLFPTIIISLLLGMKNGFISMKYPTLYIKDTMTSLKPIPNYFDIIKAKMGSYPWFNKTALGYYAPSHKTFVDVVAEHNKTELIPFYKYLLMVLLLTILFIGFAVALVQLISAIINHEIISFLVATGVFIIGTLISSPFKYEKHLNLSPFTMENASRIIIGTYNVTALTSILILLGFTILLLIIGVIYFKKKEI